MVGSGVAVGGRGIGVGSGVGVAVGWGVGVAVGGGVSVGGGVDMGGNTVTQPVEVASKVAGDCT